MDRVTLYKAVSDVLLGTYGAGDIRVAHLTEVFGKNGQKAVQTAVNDAVKAKRQTFIMAVATIAGHYGRGTERKKKLGKYEPEVQAEVNRIYNLRGKSTEEAARAVISGAFDKDNVRTLLLNFCDYDPAAVQAKVNDILIGDTVAARVRLHVPRFWENNQDKYYGDESIFIEYDKDGKITHVVIFDTGMSGSLAVKKAQELGITDVDVIAVTHDHGDHMGLVKAFVDTFTVGTVYLPDQTGVRKYQPSYAKRMDDLEKHCKSKGVTVKYIKPGGSFSVGALRVVCIFQADAGKLPEKDSHHFINNMSAVYKVTVNGLWRILIGGDLSADGIRQMMAAGVDFACDIFKFFWHSDRGAILEKFAKALKGVLVAYTQYHHKESKSNGRKATHNLLRNVGAMVVRVCEEGAIDMIMEGRTLTVNTVNGTKKTFKK